MRSFKSNENIHKKGGGSYYVVSANKASSVTLQSPGNESQRKAKLHKRRYKARFIANSSPCTTTKLSKLLTSCLTAVKNHVIRYCEKVYDRLSKTFWSIKHSGEVPNKLKSRGFRATSLSTDDFSKLYTTLPHNLIKEKLINLIEWTFKSEGSPYIACNDG